MLSASSRGSGYSEIRRVARSPQSDFQQYEVYAWEDSFTKWAGNRATEQELRKALVRAARLYRVPVPELRFYRRDGNAKYKIASSLYEPDLHRIYIRPRHRRLNVLLHEAAHAIVDWLLGPYSRAAHGKAWLGVYLELLAHFKVMPRAVLEYSAKLAGLKWSRRVSPKRIRRNYARQTRDARRLRRLMALYQ
jgi:hypothetical protein